MTVGSLFAGIGGFDLAAERAGMDVVWQSEIDPHASRVLDHHWPHVKNLGDVHDLESPPAADVLTGGFPCQDYSVAGARDGLAGDRGALWWEYHRLIARLRPTWVVGENVPGLLSSRGGRDFETIVGSLTELGYGVAWAVLDAQYFGVAQRRRRVFIVGHSGGQPRPEVLALGEGVFGDSPPSREAGQDVAATLETRPTDSRGRVEDGHLITAHESGQGWWNQSEVAGTLRAEGENRPSRPSNIVAHGFDLDGGLIAQVGSQVRRLTPLECERLQGFPDGWTDIPGNSDTQRYRQLGNAVAVPVVEWILRNIAGAE